MFAIMQMINKPRLMSGDYRTKSALLEYGVQPYWHSHQGTEMKVEYFSSIDSTEPFLIEHWVYDVYKGTRIL